MTAPNGSGTIVRGGPDLEEPDTWERESPPIRDESPLKRNLGPELSTKSNIQHSDLIIDLVPPTISQSLKSAKNDSKPQEKNVDRLKQDNFAKMSDAAATPATGSKTVSSFSSRTLVIFGMLNLVAGAGLGAVLVYKSGWNSHAHRSYEPVAAVTSVQTTPVVAPAADSNLSETTNLLKSVSTELTSLRQDIRSLVGELAQIREAQKDLMAAQERKSQRPEVRTSDRRNTRAKAVNNGASSSTSKTEKPSTDIPSVAPQPSQND